MKMRAFLFFALSIIAFVISGKFFSSYRAFAHPNPFVHTVERRSFPVNVHAVGELEALQSTVISSPIRGDMGKIIALVKDGASVKKNDVLVRMDPTPFEEKIEEIKGKLQQQEILVEACEQALEQEISSTEHEQKMADFDLEQAAMDYNKIIHGDGPMEISRLKSIMNKAKSKLEEMIGYVDDLLFLEEQGYVNENERRQAEKKVEEERENYESARDQYESFIQHAYPIQVKKAEASLERAKLKKEETLKNCGFKIGKAYAQVDHAKREYEECKNQLHHAKWELSLTEIVAPSDGMVVLREEYRAGQRRKPIVGDVLIKNQPLLDLPDLRSMAVKTKVREVDLHKIGMNKAVTIEVDAYPDLLFTGKVQWVGVLAQTDFAKANEEKFFEVKVLIDEPNEQLRPGMTARIVIHADYVDEGMTIPIHAVFFHNKHPFCYVDEGKKIKSRPITMGATNEQWASVNEGLALGERVYTSLPKGK